MVDRPYRDLLAPDYVIPSVRVYTRPAVEQDTPERTTRKRRRRPQKPTRLLVFDTETVKDDTQRLLFGFYRDCRVKRGKIRIVEEGIIHADGLADERPGEYAHLVDYANEHKPEVDSTDLDRERSLKLRSRADFIRNMFIPACRNGRAWIVGFNLPFDLSRVAFDWGPARGQYYGGFWLSFDESEYSPRVRIKTIDSKRSLISISNPDERKRKRDAQHASFVDLRALGFALTNQSLSLGSACHLFDVPGTKTAASYGVITPEFIVYARNDVRITLHLYEKMMEEHARHPIATPATKALSPASIGKGYLDAMGITPIGERCRDLPDQVNGMASAAYFGGRTEMHIRGLAPVVLTDFMAMYSTVNALMDVWRFVIAERIEYEDATDDICKLLREIAPEDCFNQALWPAFVGLALIEPDGDKLPVRANYSAMYDGQVNDVAVGSSQIGNVPFTSNDPYVFAVPDLIASKLATGKTPKIRRAIRFRPVGVLPGLRSVRLRGELPADPTSDFFRLAIELRYQTKHNPDLDPVLRGRLVEFLKVLANATGYGIYAEITRHERPKDDPVKIVVSDGQETFETTTTSPETPGPYSFMPLAANITAGARLMLALLIHETTVRGGSYSFTDTDSLAIVATETGTPSPRVKDLTATDLPTLSWSQVNEIVDKFARLNPYDPSVVPGSILKIEDENYTPDGSQRQLYCYGISSKRYALFTIADSTPDIVKIVDDSLPDPYGECSPDIVKYSEHGLGYLQSPVGAGKQWIKDIWTIIVRDALGLPFRKDLRSSEPEWLDLQATGRETLTTPTLLKAFDAINKRRKPHERIRPFTFFVTAYTHHLPSGVPDGADRSRFFLMHPFETDKRKLARARWVDRYSGKRYKIRAKKPDAYDTDRSLAYVKSYRDVIDAYREHAEYKFAAPSGVHPSEAIGELQPRAVTSLVRPNRIGKEANKIEERSSHLLDCAEVTNVYRRSRVPGNGPRIDDPVWTEIILPILRRIGSTRLAKEIGSRGLHQREIHYVLAQTTMPLPMHRSALQRRAFDFAASEGQRFGLPWQRDPLARCKHILDYYALNPDRCVVCQKPLSGQRERFCSTRCKSDHQQRTRHRDRLNTLPQAGRSSSLTIRSWRLAPNPEGNRE